MFYKFPQGSGFRDRLQGSSLAWLVDGDDDGINGIAPSGLLHFWQQLPPALQQRLQTQATVVVASERLGDQAHALGLQRVVRAAGPTTAQLVAAAHATLTVPAAT